MTAATITQTQRLRKYLESGRAINPLQAWKELGIYRLAARIDNLRNAGVDISSEFIEVRNIYGEKCRVKQYWLAGVA